MKTSALQADYTVSRKKLEWRTIDMPKYSKKNYEAYEASEPKKVVDKERKEASKKLGKPLSKTTHKDAEKLEPVSVKKKEAKMAVKKSR